MAIDTSLRERDKFRPPLSTILFALTFTPHCPNLQLCSPIVTRTLIGIGRYLPASERSPYSQPGLFDVNLIVSNTHSSYMVSKPDLIRVTPEGERFELHLPLLVKSR